MNSNIESRSHKVFDFMDSLEKEGAKEAAIKNLQERPESKLYRIGKNTEECKDAVAVNLLGRLLVDAVPLDDDYKDTNREQLMQRAAKFFADRGGLLYMYEGLNKYNSPKLSQFIEKVEQVAKDYKRDKALNVGALSVDDLDYDINKDTEKLDKISEDLEFDELAEVIRQNVKTTTLEEIQRVKDDEAQKAELENELATDDSVTTESAVTKELIKRGLYKEKSFYEPSIFESILTGNFKNINEFADKDEALGDAIVEFTLVNIASSFKMENFNNPATKHKVVKEYLGK